MQTTYNRQFLVSATLITALLLADPAMAFRCGTKLVKDGMHEAEVVAICGEPATKRNLGYALRSYGFRQFSRGWHVNRGGAHDYLTQEVIITEYVYNLGPRKLMRRLVFEGGILITVETLGYGHRK